MQFESSVDLPFLKIFFYTSRGHHLPFFDPVIFVSIGQLDYSAITGLLSRFNRPIGTKSKSTLANCDRAKLSCQAGIPCGANFFR
jgi:hypothetical protein